MRLAILLLAVLPLAAFAQEKLYVQNKAGFYSENSARESIKDECALEDDFGGKFYAAVARLVPEAQAFSDQPPPEGSASVTVSILTASGAGGGAWSGAKSLTARAEYKVGDKLIGSELASASSRGGVWGGFMGTCAILTRDSDSVAKKLAVWVRTMHGVARQQAQAKSADAPVPTQALTVSLILPITLREDANVRQAIKDECALSAMTEGYLQKRANERKLPLKPVTDYDNHGFAMRVQLNNVAGYGGGEFSGEKTVSAHVDLLRDGTVIAGKDFERTTKGGLFSSSCRIFENLISSFAVVSVNWTKDQLTQASTATPVAPLSAANADADKSKP